MRNSPATTLFRVLLPIWSLQTLLQHGNTVRFSVEAFLAPTWRTSHSSPTFLMESKSSDTNVIPPEIETKALAQIYPALIEHKEKYGNPNIPLGTPEGRQCYNVRRMQSQGKLTEAEVEHLAELGFIFHTLEDVYEHADFEDMLGRLTEFKAENGHLDIKKKHALDPELGAWVTGVRRLGKERLDPEHVKRLDDIGFLWVSPRQCGSKFMTQYREIQGRVQKGESKEEVFKDPEVVKFIRSQKQAYKRDTLSETRVEYMNRLVGENWWEKED